MPDDGPDEVELEGDLPEEDVEPLESAAVEPEEAEERDELLEDGRLPDERPGRLSPAGPSGAKKPDFKERGWWGFIAGPEGKLQEYTTKPLERITSQSDLEGLADAMAKEILLFPAKLLSDILKGAVYLSGYSREEKKPDEEERASDAQDRSQEQESRSASDEERSAGDEERSVGDEERSAGDRDSSTDVQSRSAEVQDRFSREEGCSTDEALDVDVENTSPSVLSEATDIGARIKAAGGSLAEDESPRVLQSLSPTELEREGLGRQ